MAKYVAKPIVVDAFEIKEVNQTTFDINNSEGFGAMYALLVGDLGTEENDRRVIATPAMTARMVPQIGDYWVIRPDGYVYLNPKSVFEDKYDPR